MCSSPLTASRSTRSRSPRHRLLALVIGAFVVIAPAAVVFAQQLVTSRNVNMVAGTRWPDGDPYLQRQNEP